MKASHSIFFALPLVVLGTGCLGSDDVRFDLGVDAAPNADADTPDAGELDLGSEDASGSDLSSTDLGGGEDGSADVGPADSSPLVVNVLNAADETFAAGTGALAIVDGVSFVASTATTVVVYGLSDGAPAASHVPLVLTSTQFGGNAAGGLATFASGGSSYAFFLPTGSPQVGLIDLTAPGSVETESALAADLAGGFSADIEVADDHLYVSDAPFGADSAVRSFGLANFTLANPLTEAPGRRFTLPTEDFDGDGSDDVLVGGRLAFSDDGQVGFVAFTVLGNSAPALAGGVLAFDTTTGLELGRVLVPTAGSSTIAQGFVSGFAISDSELLVVTAEKQFVPSFSELGGHLSIYEIESMNPFSVRDADATANYDQPASRLATSDDNPVGLAVIDDVVLVVDAPFFLDGTLDVFELGAVPAHRFALPLGSLYQTGYSVPADPVRVPGTRVLLLATEAGTLRFEVEPR